MFYKAALVLVLLICGYSHQSFSDSPMDKTPLITQTIGGQYYFIMMPERYYKDSKRRVPAHGAAYELLKDGSSKKLWEVSGWYAFSVYLSSDGRYLARTGNWAMGHKPSHEETAVEFYDNGKLLKRYSTRDIIENDDSVQRSTNHYQWRHQGGFRLFINRNNEFRLRTIENVDLTFDVTTGEIKRKKIMK